MRGEENRDMTNAHGGDAFSRLPHLTQLVFDQKSV